MTMKGHFLCIKIKQMATNKKSFLLYVDLIHTIEKLPDDYAGKVFKHLLQYVNDRDPVTDDIVVNIAFEPIKQSLKRDLVRWDETREKRSKAGKISAEKRTKTQQIEHMLTHVESVEHMSTQSNTPQQSATKSTDNVNVNVNVINKDSNDVNVKTIDHVIDFDSLLKLINDTFKRNFRTINSKNRTAFMARLKQGYRKDDIATAIINCKSNEYHINTNYRYCTPEFFSRADVLDKYSNVTISDVKVNKPNAKSVPCWNR
jgi:uncharacterized phage protein (TIGR02220 family)